MRVRCPQLLNRYSIHGPSGAFSQHTLLGIPRAPVLGSSSIIQRSYPVLDATNIRLAIHSVAPKIRTTVNRLIKGRIIQSRRRSGSSFAGSGPKFDRVIQAPHRRLT